MAGSDELVADGKDRIELGATLKDGGPAAIGSVFVKAEKEAATYQAIIRDIASVLQRKEQVAADEGKRKPAAWNDRLELVIAEQVSAVAETEGLDRNVLGPAIGQMLGDLEYADAMKVAPVLAKFVVGQKADAGASAALVARLNADFHVDAAAMPAALSRVAAFGKDNGVESTELVKAMQVLLDDLKFMGYEDSDATQRALAMLRKGMTRFGGANAAATKIHEELQKDAAKGGNAEKAEALKKLKAKYGLDDGVKAAGDNLLERDQQAQNSQSGVKWNKAGEAVRNASVDVGNALRPATDAAADALRDLAASAGAMARENPGAVQGGAVAMTVVGTVVAAMAARSMASGIVSAGKGLFGKGKADGGAGVGGSEPVQPVRVTNWREGGFGGDAGGGTPDGKGSSGKDKKKQKGKSGTARNTPGTPQAANEAAEAQPRERQVPKLLQAPQQKPPGLWARTATRGRAAAAWAGNLANRVPGSALARTAMSKAGWLVRGASLAGAAWGTYQTADAVFRGNSAEERKRGIKMGLAMAAGAVVGGVLLPGVGIAGGAAAGQALYQMFGTSEEEAKAKAEEKKPVAKAANASAAPAPASMASPQLKTADTVSTPRREAEVKPAPALPGAAVVAAATAGAARRGATDMAPVQLEGRQAAAASQAAAATAPAPGKSAPAMPQPAPQLHFNPTVTVNVQGDVREPRRIAEELMPYLRQLFDQFQGQQQRSSLFDAPLTAGGYAT